MLRETPRPENSKAQRRAIRLSEILHTLVPLHSAFPSAMLGMEDCEMTCGNQPARGSSQIGKAECSGESLSWFQSPAPRLGLPDPTRHIPLIEFAVTHSKHSPLTFSTRHTIGVFAALPISRITSHDSRTTAFLIDSQEPLEIELSLSKQRTVVPSNRQ